MLTINKDGKDVNIKRVGEGAVQTVVLDVIKHNHPKKYEVIDYYFKKYKFKPHKLLNEEMSFIECAMKHDPELLFKYVKDIDIKVPGYNVINACIVGGRTDLLKKYIKKKGHNLNEMIGNQTPLLCAVKQKNLEIFDLLVKAGCKLNDIDSEHCTPLVYIQKSILSDVELGITENEKFYYHAIKTLLPVQPSTIYNELLDQSVVLRSPYLDFVTCDRMDMTKELYELHGNKNFLLQLTTHTNLHTRTNEFLHFLDMAYEDKTFEFAKEIFDRRPYIVLAKYSETERIIQKICAFGSTKFLNYFVEKYVKVISQMPEAYFNLLMNDSLTLIKKVIEFDKSIVNTLSDKGENMADFILLSDFSTDHKIECLEYFKSMGLDLGYCDDDGSSILRITIQYGDTKLLTYVLDQIGEEKIKKWHEIVQHGYIDCPIVQACHYEKLEFVKLLVECGFEILTSDEYLNDGTTIKIPICVTTVIFRGSADILQYMIECPEFGIEREQKEFIFNFAKSNKCSNKLLSMFDDTYEDVPDVIDPEILRLNGMMSSFFPRYSAELTRENFDSNFRIISSLKTLVLVLLKICQTENSRKYKSSFFSEASSSFKKYFDHKYDPPEMINMIQNFEEFEFDARELQRYIIIPLLTNELPNLYHLNSIRDDIIPFVEKIKSFDEKLNILYKVLTDCEATNILEFENIPENKKRRCYCEGCGEYTGTIKTTEQIDNSGNAPTYCQLVSTQPGTFKGFRESKLPASFKHQPSNDDNDENEITELIRTYHSFTIHPTEVEMLLERVAYPFEAQNYQLLKNFLLENVVCTEQDNKYTIYEKSKPIAVIYKNNKSPISCWIEHYGYNICEKMDKNHMFTFGIDIIIHNVWKTGKIKCGYAITETSKNIYIYGKVYMDGRWTRGYFEYFLNDKNILFHRLFKPLNMKHYPQNK